LPAITETATVPGPTRPFNAGTTSAATCGLTAMTITDASPIDAGLMRTPRGASAAMSGAGCGSWIATFAGSSPSASQPSSIAPPILPAPTSTSVPEKSLSVLAMDLPSMANAIAELAPDARHGQQGIPAGPG